MSSATFQQRLEHTLNKVSCKRVWESIELNQLALHLQINTQQILNELTLADAHLAHQVFDYLDAKQDELYLQIQKVNRLDHLHAQLTANLG